MLEIPIQGWQDWLWWEVHGWQKVREYIDYVKGILMKIKKRKRVLSWCLHDITMARDCRGPAILEGVVSAARELEIEILTHGQFYQQYFKEAN